MSQDASRYSPAGSHKSSSSTSPPSSTNTSSVEARPSYVSVHASSLRRTPFPRRPSSEYVSPYPPLPSSGIQASLATSSRVGMSRSTEAADPPRRLPSSATSPASSSTEGSMTASAVYDTAATGQARRAAREAQLMPEAQKVALVDALKDHRINTLAELRRIERIFAQIGTNDVTQPMTAAWVYYVNSNSLLSELRSLTKNYPFSADLIEDAKKRVHQDPGSNRSWNYCWLVLAKIHTDRLVPLFARQQAGQPVMWGGRRPKPEELEQLASAFMQEWTSAIEQFLRYWEAAPVT